MGPAPFTNFFAASAGAAAALVGLLFVAVSLSPQQTVARSAPIDRQAVAGSVFTALLNAFFISLSGLIPAGNLGDSVLVVAVVSIGSSLILGWNVLHAAAPLLQRLRRSVLLAVSIAAYALEVWLGRRMLRSPASTDAYTTLARLLLAIYGLSMIRAWELLGASRHSVTAVLGALADRTASGSPSDRTK
jgi:hypothetical protein